LIVSTAARAKATSELGPDNVDERGLEGAVNILIVGTRHECSGLETTNDLVEARVHRLLFRRGQVPGSRKSLRVGM
jgi:hypothetical protein